MEKFNTNFVTKFIYKKKTYKEKKYMTVERDKEKG